MDLFFNVDWNKMKIIIGDIEQIAYNYNDESAKDKIELTKLFYQVERDLASVKQQLQLPNLNPLIFTESVVSSLNHTPTNKDIFDKDNFQYDDFFRQNDYQYWLLVYLLLKNNEIREKKSTLYEIIDNFVSSIKDKSLTWRDIEYTGSGATRCKTNLRFAYNDLKKIGLVNLYEKKYKTSWSLTYLGFFIATSFCLNPVDKEKSPFAKKLTRFNQSTFYFKINKHIWERINELSNPGYFNSLIQYLGLESLGLKELEKGPKIFNNFYQHVTDLYKKRISVSKKEQMLNEYLEEVNQKYSLQDYMDDLTTKFNAEAFFAELIKKSNQRS